MLLRVLPGCTRIRRQSLQYLFPLRLLKFCSRGLDVDRIPRRRVLRPEVAILTQQLLVLCERLALPLEHCLPDQRPVRRWSLRSQPMEWLLRLGLLC